MCLGGGRILKHVYLGGLGTSVLRNWSCVMRDSSCVMEAPW